MHPEIVRLAQQELDEVTGGERLPDFSDKPKLPYISAVMKEVLRWKTPNPLATVSPYFFFRENWPETEVPGVPHRLMEDDVYEGWFIPAGAIVFDNP